MASAAEIQSAVQRLLVNLARLDLIVNGPASGSGSTVTLDGSETVKTIRRVLSELGGLDPDTLADLPGDFANLEGINRQISDMLDAARAKIDIGAESLDDAIDKFKNQIDQNSLTLSDAFADAFAELGGADGDTLRQTLAGYRDDVEASIARGDTDILVQIDRLSAPQSNLVEDPLYRLGGGDWSLNGGSNPTIDTTGPVPAAILPVAAAGEGPSQAALLNKRVRVAKDERFEIAGEAFLSGVAIDPELEVVWTNSDGNVVGTSAVPLAGDFSRTGGFVVALSDGFAQLQATVRADQAGTGSMLLRRVLWRKATTGQTGLSDWSDEESANIARLSRIQGVAEGIVFDRESLETAIGDVAASLETFRLAQIDTNNAVVGRLDELELDTEGVSGSITNIQQLIAELETDKYEVTAGQALELQVLDLEGEVDGKASATSVTTLTQDVDDLTGALNLQANRIDAVDVRINGVESTAQTAQTASNTNAQILNGVNFRFSASVPAPLRADATGTAVFKPNVDGGDTSAPGEIGTDTGYIDHPVTGRFEVGEFTILTPFEGATYPTEGIFYLILAGTTDVASRFPNCGYGATARFFTATYDAQADTWTTHGNLSGQSDPYTPLLSDVCVAVGTRRAGDAGIGRLVTKLGTTGVIETSVQQLFSADADQAQALLEVQSDTDAADSKAQQALNATASNASLIQGVQVSQKSLEQSLVPSTFDSLAGFTTAYTTFAGALDLSHSTVVTQILDDPDYGTCIEVTGNTPVNFIQPQRIDHTKVYELRVRFKVVSSSDGNCRLRAQWNTFAPDGTILDNNSQQDFGPNETTPVNHTVASGDTTAVMRFRGLYAPTFNDMDWSGAQKALTLADKFIRAGFRANAGNSTDAVLRVASIEWLDVTDSQKVQTLAFQAFTATQDQAQLISQVSADTTAADSKAQQALNAAGDNASALTLVESKADAAQADADAASAQAVIAQNAATSNGESIADIFAIARSGGLGGELHPNPYFNEWADGAPVPDGASIWRSGGTRQRVLATQFGRYGARLDTPATVENGFYFRFDCSPGKHILRCAAERLSGTFQGAHLFCSWRDAANVALGSTTLQLWAEPDTNGYSGANGDGVRIWEMEAVAPAGTVDVIFYVMGHWGAGDISAANALIFHMADLQPQPLGQRQASLALSATDSNSQAILTAQSDANSADSKAQLALNTANDADGTLSAGAVLKVGAGNVIGGMRLHASGQDVSAVWDVGYFAVKTASGSQTPFSVSGNEVRMYNVTVNKFQANSVKAEAIDVTSLSAISATIGLLRTRTSGARVEIEDDQIRVYDASNTLRVRLGIW